VSRTVLTKAGAAIVLIAAVLVMPSTQRGWLVYGLLFFGIANVLFDVPGTMLIRTIAVAGTFVALVWQDSSAASWAVLLAWLLWPPAFMVAWALGKRSRNRNADQRAEDAAAKSARIGMAAIIAAVATGSIAYRLLVLGSLQQTAALFIGLPALLALVVVFGVSPRSATGVACKAVTVGLLVSLLFLGEGVLCIVMSAPLFYAVAIAIAKGGELLQRRRNRETTLLSSLVIVAILPMTVEGTLPATTVSRSETVALTRVVDVPAASVERALFQTPRFDREIPLWLRGGFPRPISTEIKKGSDGIRWIVRFRGGEMRITGIEPQTGDLILRLEDERQSYVRWRAISDSSHMTHFLRWREISAEWSPIDGERSQVTWTIRYDRGLDPAWYFGPLERYAVRLAAGYLIESVATP